ncbi:MAG TPA: TerC/Alx family metal homeostasis membrane protein [Gemmatimonadaceae bacterium]
MTSLGWIIFGVIVIGALLFDLSALRRSKNEDEGNLRGAATRSALIVGLAVAFGIGVGLLFGRDAGVAYITAYFLEESLSIDNIFVFILIFGELRIPPDLQRGVLLAGVVGALVARALLIASGLYVFDRFHWLVYPFGAFIIFAAIRLVFGQQKQREIVVQACSVCSTWVARIIPITPQFHGRRFLVRLNGRLVATPLLVALIIIETTDIVFALDSVPAVLSVTRDPFIVYTSNVFAMLGLRSLYFVLAGVLERFRYIRLGLAAILVFFGVRLVLSGVIEFPNHISLAVIAAALTLSIAASLKWPAPRPT